MDTLSWIEMTMLIIFPVSIHIIRYNWYFLICEIVRSVKSDEDRFALPSRDRDYSL